MAHKKDKKYEEWIQDDTTYHICKCGGTFKSNEALYMHIKDAHLKYSTIPFDLEKYHE